MIKWLVQWILASLVIFAAGASALSLWATWPALTTRWPATDAGSFEGIAALLLLGLVSIGFLDLVFGRDTTPAADQTFIRIGVSGQASDFVRVEREGVRRG